MKKNLGRILIVIGILIIIIAVFIKLYTKYTENKYIKKYTVDITETSNKDSNDSDEKTDNSSILLDNQKIIGIISIPKIDLTAAIEEGTSSENLRYSVGHFENTAMPGENGNCCITGHRSYTFGQYFNRLDELTDNDTVIIKRGKEEFEYRVIEKSVVLPEEVSVLNKTDDVSLTLITCTPIRVGTHRLVIKAQLERKNG